MMLLFSLMNADLLDSDQLDLTRSKKDSWFPAEGLIDS